ncbi:MAG TPA: glutathione S-transferase family protein [Azospirillaceae bacterium]|nr:glutathione S-transferase family protein [Azospirillaceae bacterium]
MTRPYTLFYYPGSANLAPHMLLREIGAPFELALVDKEAGAQRHPDYLRLNPTGRIPTLIEGDTALFETAAILLYLTERHPEAGLAPPPGSPDRARFLALLFHLTNTIQPEYRAFFYAEQHAETQAGVAEVKRVAERRLGAMFDVIERELEGRPFLLGDRPSAADFLLFMLVRWGRWFERRPATLPNLGRFAEAMLGRASVRDAFAAEGISEPWY